ncbi:MAG TPA: BON domain-containing protein [Pyrinomonadaceae bacterium]|nr:BON domain-containing protein [Pyrinomonadaceae bacterium]
MKKLATLLVGTTLAAFTAACGETTTTTNTNNSNTAVVTNTNNRNTNTNANTNTNTNTNTNANVSYNANLSREEYERDKARYSGEASRAGDKIGTEATDGWLWVKTKAALAAADDLRDSTINVDVENGVITLRGDVASQAQVKAADAAAKGIEGKKSVKNMLKVAAGGSGNSNNRNGNGNSNRTE